MQGTIIPRLKINPLYEVPTILFPQSLSFEPIGFGKPACRLTMLGILLAVLGGVVAGVLTVLAIAAAYASARFVLPAPVFAHALALSLPGLTYLVLAVPSRTQRLFPASRIPPSALPILLSILEAVLATLGAVQLDPTYLTCSLNSRWQKLFVAKDAKSIRGIQDALQCCGLWSNVDRAWPFADATHNANACLLAFDREQSCGEGWAKKTEFVLGVWIAIGVYGLLVKTVMGLLRHYHPAGKPHYRGYEPIRDDARSNSDGHIRYLDGPAEEDRSRQTPEAIQEVDDAQETEGP